MVTSLFYLFLAAMLKWFVNDEVAVQVQRNKVLIEEVKLGLNFCQMPCWMKMWMSSWFEDSLAMMHGCWLKKLWLWRRKRRSTCASIVHRMQMIFHLWHVTIASHGFMLSVLDW